MELKMFWNKAIEYYCTQNRFDNNDSFDTIFIPVAEESLVEIKEKYFNETRLSEHEIELTEKNIENIGGVIKSYYSSIKEVHNDLNNPEQFSFLRFSILVLGAFKQDESSLKNYWKDFDPFLIEKGIKVISNRTKYLDDLIFNLSRFCYLKHNRKTFFNLNVFGDNSPIVNVGRIKAHSVFQGSNLEEIKKSIYNLGFSDSHNIEDLSYEDVELILKESGLIRILNLFNRDKDAKEIVYVCLKIWLKNWTPKQEEKVRLLKGKSSSNKSHLSIQRLWSIARGKIGYSIDIKFGFIYRSELGEEGVYFLNKDDNIFIDTSWAIKLSVNRILYVIENFTLNSDLNQNELGLKFNSSSKDFNENAYALEKIPNRDYFIELKGEHIIIKDNPIVLASKNEVQNYKAQYIYDFPIPNYDKFVFKLYRINDSFEFLNLNFIKSNVLNISPIGISDGRSGYKSFLSSFPIKIKFNNLTSGEIHIFKRDKIIDKIIDKIELNEVSNKLDSEKVIGVLESGEYSIQYLDDNNNYLNFQNGLKSIDFEIVQAGIKDRRVDFKIELSNSFAFHEFRYLKYFENIDDSCLILHEDNDLLEFKDVHTDFYFSKSEKGEWVLKPNRSLFFLQRLMIKPGEFREEFSSWTKEMEYLSKSFSNFKYKIQFCERAETICLKFDLNNYFQRDNQHRITQKYIKVDCYYFKLISMDEDLSIKYPDVCIGDVIYIVSNKREMKPENLLKLINQEYFPFKKYKNV